MFGKNKKEYIKKEYTEKDTRTMDLVELLREFRTDIDVLKSKVKEIESLRDQNMVLDSVISIMLENPDYANLNFYVTFSKIVHGSYHSSGFVSFDLEGKIILLKERVFFDNLYSAAMAYVKAIDSQKSNVLPGSFLKLKIQYEYKNKENNQKNYRLTRTDDLENKVYMYFEEDTNTPYYTSVEAFAFTAPLEEIKKWKTPAWEIEEVPNEAD